MTENNQPIRRLYQQHALGEFILARSRFWALLWERQAGKSTTLADFALYEMLRHTDRTVIYGSASLLLGQEITLKAAIRTDQSIRELIEGDAAVLKHFADTAQSTIDAQAQNPVPPNPFSGMTELLNKLCAAQLPKNQRTPLRKKYDLRQNVVWPRHGDLADFLPVILALRNGTASLEFKTFDSSTGKEIIGGRGASAKQISAAGFAELFSKQRLEFRVYHGPTSYSRTKVIAPNLATARSWSGTVLLDEVAFIRNLRELMTALLPVISTDKQFKLILSTTPPEFNDTHYSFELLAPSAGQLFSPRAEGNWYQSESGVRVHRADAFDTHLAGKRIFDLKTGGEITPAEAFTRAPNKDGHRIAHWLTWMLGGSAACDLARLITAQERGANVCQNFLITTDAEMLRALNWLAQHYSASTLQPVSLWVLMSPPPPKAPVIPLSFR